MRNAPAPRHRLAPATHAGMRGIQGRDRAWNVICLAVPLLPAGSMLPSHHTVLCLHTWPFSQQQLVPSCDGKGQPRAIVAGGQTDISRAVPPFLPSRRDPAKTPVLSRPWDGPATPTTPPIRQPAKDRPFCLSPCGFTARRFLFRSTQLNPNN